VHRRDRAEEAERYNYSNAVQGLYRMAREEGIATWYKGVGPNVVRGVSNRLFTLIFRSA
jgi:hypothetical protein